MIRKILNFLFPPLWDGGDVNDRWPQPTKEEFDRQLEEQLRLFQEKKQAADYAKDHSRGVNDAQDGR